jgi:hypothetical protein
MRIHAYATGLLSLALLAAAVTGVAQKFQEPTKEELQMTSDPKAPGAAAVFLYREEETSNRDHYISEYARIKVLTEKGKEWATVEVPYDPGSSAQPIIEARTIHADGTVIPLVGRASDLLAFKTTNSKYKASVFNMPSVEVGSILEYKRTVPLTGERVSGVLDDEQDVLSDMLAGSIPEWEVQRPLYVHKEHFYWNPHSGIGGVDYYVDGERAHYLLFTERLPSGFNTIRSTYGDYTLDIQDVPAAMDEANAPPKSSFLYRVRFYYSPYVDAALYWDSELKRWSGELDRYAAQTSTIHDAANQLTAGADTPEAKAGKLYDAVQALNNTDFSRAKDEAERKQLHLKRELKKAQDVRNEKSGSGNDIAALYLALARAAGLQADGLKVADRNRHIFDPNYLNLYQLDSLLVVLHIDGKEIYLDPGEKLCPFGQLHWTHVMAGGLEENARALIYAPANGMKDAVTAHAADLTVDAQGGMTGTVKILMNGPAALYWRQLNLTTDADEVKKQFDESLHELLPQGISGEAMGFQGMDTSAGYLSAAVKVSGQLGNATGKRMILPGVLLLDRRAHAVCGGGEARVRG